MQADTRQAVGALEAAGRAHGAAGAVLAEACALDRELGRAEVGRPGGGVDWGFMLWGVEAFAEHYPATLVGAPPAIQALGRGCLAAIQRAPAPAQARRGAEALLRLLASLSAEVARVGSEHLPPEVPQCLSGLVRSLGETGLALLGASDLPVLQEIARRTVLVAEEGRPPALWFQLLARTLEFLLQTARRALAQEVAYDGRWDGSVLGAQLQAERLEPVRRERLEAERAWLENLLRELKAGQRAPVELFLALKDYAGPRSRAAAWDAWLEAVLVADLSRLPEVVAELQASLATWMAEAVERDQFGRFSAALRRLAEQATETPGALEAAAERLLPPILARLEREAGRGALEPAHEELHAAAAALLLGLPASPARGQQALGLRTGPVAGLPLSLTDLRFRLALVALRPAWARDQLLALLTAFGLERIRLPQAQPGPACLADALADLLGRCHPEALWFPLRAVIRLAPLAPLALAGPTTRATLLALSPAGPGRGGYLAEFCDRALLAPGPENLEDVERVLAYWRTLDPGALQGLASPDALAVIPLSRERDRHIQRLLAGLWRHAPAEDKQGERWLAGLPETFSAPDTLRKLAGFEGVREEAVQTLARLLVLQRALVDKYATPRSVAVVEDGRDAPALLARADQLLATRAELLGALFPVGPGPAGVCPGDSSALGRLERFLDDLSLAAELDSVLEALARRVPAAAVGGDVDGLALVRRMLAHARLSGLPTGELAVRLEREERLTPAGRADLHVALQVFRSSLVEELGPHVLESCRRLRANPLARPVAVYRRFFEEREALAPERVAAELGPLLADDLLAADGGWHALWRFTCP
jgi:hypothetical protein